MIKINKPKKLSIANIPTPIHLLGSISRNLNAKIMVKRDDYTGLITSGNKIRKLEYLMYDAINSECDTIVTIGGIQSNHCRATTAIAKQYGFNVVLILCGENPERYTSNLLLNKMLGAEIIWVDQKQYNDTIKLFEKVKNDLQVKGLKPYFIPEGGSNAIGVWGYIDVIKEIIDFQEKNNVVFDSIFCATGTGGTHSGLLIGKKLFNLNCNICSFNVNHTGKIFERKISELINQTIEKYSLKINIDDKDIHVIDGYVGPGYAKMNDSELVNLIKLIRLEGIFFDQVYTGKTFLGFLQEYSNKSDLFGKNVLFINTGGMFGLFAEDEQITRVINNS